jgi:hypothetical protein
MGILGTNMLQASLVEVTDHLEFDLGLIVEVTDQVRAPIAAADNSHPYHFPVSLT